MNTRGLQIDYGENQDLNQINRNALELISIESDLNKQLKNLNKFNLFALIIYLKYISTLLQLELILL